MWRPLIIIFLQIAIQLQLLRDCPTLASPVPRQSCTRWLFTHVSIILADQTHVLDTPCHKSAILQRPSCQPAYTQNYMNVIVWQPLTYHWIWFPQHLAQQTLFIYRSRSRLAWCRVQWCSVTRWWWWCLLGAQFSESFAAAVHNGACAAPRQVIVHTLTGRLSRHRAAWPSQVHSSQYLPNRPA